MDFIFDPSLVLYLPLYKLDGASIKSQDAYGHLCTATGALWRPKGRLFDGTDDVIDCGVATAANFLAGSPHSCLAWIKADAISTTQYIVVKGTSGIAFNYLLGVASTGVLFYGNTAGNSISVTATVSALVWTQVGFVNDGTNVTFIKNGVLMDTFARANSGATNETLKIGSRGSGTPYAFDGLLGEVLIYRRVLTPAETLRNYQMTKWRYR